MQDFFSEALAYIDEPEGTGREEKSKEVIKPYTPPKKPFISPSGSSVFVSEDGSTLTIDGQIYITPEFYNKEQLKKQDAKTIEMIFYHYGLTP